MQWEFPGALGPGPGRYVLRPHAGEGPEQVLVISAGEAPRRRRLGARRARPAEPEPSPAEVPVTSATVIAAEPLVGTDAADAWLEEAAGPGAAATLAQALAALNRAVHAHRVAAADPYAAELSPDRALVTRVGYGSGEQVADGRWARARTLPPPDRTARERRELALRPQERIAALLGGRDAVLACEELALRARLDTDRGRGREAALQTHLALEAARVELAAWRELSGMTRRLAGLEDCRDAVAAAADAALQGGLPEDVERLVVEALDRIQAALRARSAGAAY